MKNGIKNKDKFVIVRMDIDLKDAAQRLATERGTTVSKLIRFLLKKKIAKHEKQNNL
jgi:antitoxin component of RelBE/YafQ-DinJ toxin-antitoxin module